nr:putative inactive leucine-rich repeat receptor kinase xiao [Quercus suber]
MGTIPSSLSNLSSLVSLTLNFNSLTGAFPLVIFNLSSLKSIAITENNLSGTLPVDLCSHCPNLQGLYISDNKFSGSLKSFYARQSQIRRQIPMGIGSLKNLTLLDLSYNKLSGNLPSTLGGLEELQRLYLGDNNIGGNIPEELCQLIKLGELFLSNNKISGSIPNCIGNLNLLQKLNLSYNKLTSSIPLSVWNLENLLFLDLSSNSLGKSLSPNMRTLRVIEYVNLSHNQITGNVPSIIGAFESLENLDLSKNSFQGHIPDSFGQLKGLDQLNLSNNNLSGAIPKSLEALRYLKYLNLSFNKLSGEIPSSGPFANFKAESFLVENKDATQTKTIGTIGYIAPEYGSEGRVSIKCDIYSYGIILLEMITRKKPTDEMFVGELSMWQWIASIPDKMKVMDDGLLKIEDGRDVTIMQTILLSILELGLRCSKELPDERLDIKDVVAKVNNIKLALLGNRNKGV